MKSLCSLPVLCVVAAGLYIAPACERPSTNSEEILGNWKTAPDFKGDARAEAATFVIGDNAYLLTGVSEYGPYNDMYVYDVDNGNWTQKATVPGGSRHGAVAFAINGKGYIVSGYSSSKSLQDCWEYDPGNDTWTQKDNLPTDGRHDAVGFAINGKGYLCGGYDRKAYNDCWEFDPAAPAGLQWKEKASFPRKTQSGTAFVLNNKGYIVTGTNNLETQKELYEFDAANNKWTTKSPLYNYSNESYDDKYTSIARQNGVSFVLGDKAYITTGETGPYVASTWAYDAEADTWKEYTGFEAKARDGAIAFTVKNRAFVLTGRNGSNYFDNMFEFSPFAEKVEGD